MFNPGTTRPETRHPSHSRCFGAAAQIFNSVAEKRLDDISPNLYLLFPEGTLCLHDAYMYINIQGQIFGLCHIYG